MPEIEVKKIQKPRNLTHILYKFSVTFCGILSKKSSFLSLLCFNAIKMALVSGFIPSKVLGSKNSMHVLQTTLYGIVY